MKRWIAALLTGAMLLCLCACELIPGSSREPIPEPTKQAAETTAGQQEASAEATDPEETEPDTTVGEIHAFAETAVYETLDFQGETYTYRIPKIVCDTPGIEAINSEIYDLYYSEIYLTDVQGALEEYGMPGLCSIDYTWGVKGDYLSVVVCILPYASSGANFGVYNVNLREGRRATDEELTAAFGFGTEAFYARAKDVMGSYYFDNLYPNTPEDMMWDFDAALARTIEESNVREAMPYVGEDGNLWMIAEIGSFAGADYYPEAVPFETYQVSDAYLNYLP